VLTVSVVNTDWLEITTELEVLEMTDVIDNTGVTCKLELGSVEFMPCDSTLEATVIGIEDTGVAVDKDTVFVGTGTTEVFSKTTTEDSGIVRVASLGGVVLSKMNVVTR